MLDNLGSFTLLLEVAQLYGYNLDVFNQTNLYVIASLKARLWHQEMHT